MAEYKGLTIRIGGDTSQLNSALKASTKSAASLESQLRQITRAMRFDPGDFGNLNTRVKLSENRMEALYSKLKLVRNGYQELGKQAVTVGGAATTVKELAKATENVELAAKTADKRYEDVTRSLAAMYREFEKLGTTSIKQALNLDEASPEIEAIIAKFRELGIITKEAGKNVDRIKLDLSDAGRVADIDELLSDLKRLGAITDEQIQSNRLMRETFKEALGDKEAYDKAAQYKKMGVDMQRIRSEAEGMAAKMREMNTVSEYSNNVWSESKAKIKSMDTALSDCAKQARAYEAALREDPSNLSAAVGRLRALASEYDLTTDKAKELSRQVEAYKSKLSGTLAEQKNLPRYIQETGDKWQQVHQDLNEAKGKADAFAQSLQKLKDQQAPVEEIKQLEAAVEEANAEVRELGVRAKQLDGDFETAKECAELQQLQSELSETESHAAQLQKRMNMQSLGGKSFLNASTIKSAGMTLYSTLTPAITMLGWRTVTAAQEMDEAYRDMRKTVDGTEAQFEELRQAAIEFSKTHVTSAEQILQIEAIGGELGIATEDLRAFAETVSNLDVATNLDTEEAASSLGKLANITHMTSDEYDNYADALVRLGNNGASTEDQIVDITTRIGSMGTIVGMTVPELLALSSSIAATGMKTEASGTAIANTISDMESAVAQGGEGLEAFASVSQMSAEEFAKTWEEEPIAAFEAFIKGLNQIEKDGGSADATLEQMGITGTRQKQAIEGLMQTIGGLDDNLKMSGDAWNGVSDQWGAAGDAAREAEKKAEGFSGQLSILSNIGNDAMASLADGAVPIIAVFTDLARAALDLFDSMDEGSKTAVVAGLGIAALSGPALTMASTFVTASQNVKAFITESNAMGRAVNIMKSGFADAGAGADGFKGKLAALGGAAKSLGASLASNLAFVAVVAGTAIAIGALTDYIKKVQESEEASKNAGNVIGTALGAAFDEQGEAIAGVGVSYDEMVSKMAESNRKIQESADETYGNTAMIEEYGEGVRKALSAYNNGDRSAESMANLKTQLELYNDAAVTSVSLSEDANGKLKLMKDGAEMTAGAFDKLTQSVMNAAKAEFFKESYTAKMEDYRTAMDKVAETQEKITAAQKALDDATAKGDWDAAAQASGQVDELNKTLDAAKQKLGETTSAVNQYEEGMKLMAAAEAAGTESAQQWMADNDLLQSTIWANSASVTEFAQLLAGLSLDYDTLSEKSAVVDQMGQSWNGTIESILPGLTQMGVKIDENTAKTLGLNAVKVGDKTYYVSDGGTIVNQEGKIQDLKELSVGSKTYKVDDGGTIWDGVNAVGTLSNDIATLPDGKVSVTAITDPATSKVRSWKARTDSTKATTKTDSNTSQADRKVKESVAKANKSEASIDVKASTNLFWNAVDKIKNAIVGTAYVNVKKKGGSYTGGYSNTPWELSGAPRMATGAIVTRPLLTNNGWVGEDGAEAVLSWATGGAVVPLTNRKYMEPIAKAIAANMDGSRTETSNTVNVYLQYDASADAAQMANDLARILDRKLAMEG